MQIVTRTIFLRSKGEGDMIDITSETSKLLTQSKIKDGIVNMLSRIVPGNIEYQHENMWHDGNGHSHVKASLIGPSLTIPFNDGTLMLGTWQQIVVLEMDINKRERNVILQIMGE